MIVDRVRVGDLLELQRRPVEVDIARPYREIGVRSFGRGIFHKEPSSGAELGNKRVFWIEPGDLVLSNVFAWEGAIAVAGVRERGFIGSHRFMTYRPIDDRIDASWAAWFFLSEPGLELIREASPGSAGRNKTLAIDRFEKLEIPLPSISDQRLAAGRMQRIRSAVDRLLPLRDRAAALAEALPLAVGVHAAESRPLSQTRLGDVLEFVRTPVEIDPVAPYTTIGVRSFGRGLFHYPERRGSEIGKLRFHQVEPDLLAVSNIKAWEGAVATTSDDDAACVASNRFLFYRPAAGAAASDYFWALLLGPDGLAALGRASPGSADRNRTLSRARFEAIELALPPPEDQIEIGKRIARARAACAEWRVHAASADERISAMVPAALNEIFADLT